MSQIPPKAGAPRKPLVVSGDDGRRYRIIEKLGQGGFGRVYRASAEDPSGVSRQVAIKILKDHVPEEMVVRFRDEVRMLGLVHHRAIVAFQGVVRIDGRPAAVLEFVPGVDLKAVIEHEQPPTCVVVRIVEEVASALHAAWAQINEETGRPLHLVHRDIKPANIRVTPGGEVRVVDFGGARADFADREARTRSFVVGSYRYMAPERLDQVDTPRSDVYSLGLVFAELLAGEGIPTPSKHLGQHDDFVEEVREAVLERCRREGLSDDLAQRVMALLEAMLDYYPERRPTAREVELQARTLLIELPGPSLREWAEQIVRRLEDARPLEATPLAWSRVVNSGAPMSRPPVPSRPPRSSRPTAPPAPATRGGGGTAMRPGKPSERPARAPSAVLASPWAMVLALVLLCGLGSSLLAQTVRRIERPAPPVREFRPVDPLPAPVTDWAPWYAEPAPPSPPAKQRVEDEDEARERGRGGIFRFFRRKRSR